LRDSSRSSWTISNDPYSYRTLQNQQSHLRCTESAQWASLQRDRLPPLALAQTQRRVVVMGAKRWSKDHIEYIVSNYGDLDIPLRRVLSHLGKSQQAVSQVANRMGLYRDGGAAKRKPFPNPFMRDDPSAMWTLGLWYTDGHVTNKAVTITQKDKGLLEQVKSIIAPYDQQDRVKIFPYCGKSQAWVLKISSVDMVQYLADCGIHQKKSRTMQFPAWLPTESLSHFSRGLWDGDGYIGVGKGNRIQATYSCGSRAFIESFALLVGSITNIVPTIHKQKLYECYTFAVTGRKAHIFLAWMYAGSQETNRLRRKYLVFEQSYPAQCAGSA
jgi:hypothetical protein